METFPVDRIIELAERVSVDVAMQFRAYGFKLTEDHVTILGMQLKALAAVAWYEEHEGGEGDG